MKMIDLATEDKKLRAGGLRYIIPASGYKPYEFHVADQTGHILYTEDRIEKYQNADWIILQAPEFVKLAKEYDDSLCDHWEEITEDRYDEMLGCLPPLDLKDGGFFMSEMHTNNITSFFQIYKSRHFTSLQRTSRPRGEILASLKLFVEGK
jgi:hypothetical protein